MHSMINLLCKVELTIKTAVVTQIRDSMIARVQDTFRKGITIRHVDKILVGIPSLQRIVGGADQNVLF